MKNNFKYLALFAAAAVFVSCENEFEDSVTDGDLYTNGTADFSKYVSVGNSLTSGYADNALYLEGQQNSFPNIMAQQFELVGGGEFNQPLVNDNLGGLLLNGNQILPNRFVLAVGANGSPGPARIGGTPTTEITNKVTGPLNNYGVPGARVFHLGAPGYGSAAGIASGTANPYFARFSSSESSTVIDDAAAANGTFFTLWIGNNDILGYATSGGSGVDNNQTGQTNPAMQGDNSITNNNTFAGVYAALVAKMTANGAKGALINIPDVTSIPYFTTIPANPIPLDATTAAGVNMAYAQYNGGLRAAEAGQLITTAERIARTINFTEGANFVVITDVDLTNLSALGLPNIRQTTAADLITLPTRALLGTLADPSNPSSVRGVGVPLANSNVLTVTEQTRVSAAQDSYNATIAAIAQSNGLALVDAKTALGGLSTGGVAFNGGILTSTFATGGAFSLDGVHPTPRGYAFTANTVLQTINAFYGSTVPKVEIGNYKTIQPSNNVAQ
ncbi:SGNH/GDSL hydrolase family protein [Nonlabens antarcticus]|uniref:SGNH/GDSL hydrolase family protein n=1 Tax=Nonlabens antarcticus TaxID=392714 RepID=UPI0018916A65|nr:SGNH/GDSL hydrolase family protein [Nonlabens antarcticus]